MRTSLLQQWLRPYRSQLSFSALLAACSVPLLIAQLWLLADIAAHLLQRQAAALSTWLSFAAIFVLRQLLLSGKELLAQQVSRQLRRELRQQLLHKVALLGPARQRFGADGSLSTLITEQVDALDGYISRYWPQLVQVVVAPLLIAIAVGWHSLFAAFLLLCTAPLVPLFMILVGREASKASQTQLAVLSRMGGRLYDFLQGLPLLKRLNATGIAQAHLTGAAERYQTSTMQVLRLAFLSTAVLELFTSLAIALVALYLGLGLLGELPWLKQQVPVLYQPALFILLLAPEFYQPLRQLGNDYHAKAQAQAASLNLTPLWQAETLGGQTATPAAQATTNSDSASQANTAPAQLPTLQSLSLQQIVVGKPESPRLALEQLQLRQGARYLVQGSSGSGKSTLLQLLAGFVPGSGQLLLNQQPLAWHELPLLRSQLAYLTQQAELLAGTVADNLQLANPDASDAQMQAALMQVDLWGFLQRQQGLQTRIGEAGSGLSGGQQQRLALARLLLQDKPIWLLDEPVAELDAQSAAQICDLLATLSQGKTLLLASHQWQDLGWLEQVIQIDQGELLGIYPMQDFLQQSPSQYHIQNHHQYKQADTP
jgi:ATP-binding cassette, subfamily C, bacterial CydD